MTKAKVVCVINNYNLFNRVVLNNKNLKGSEIFDYDNSSENISIPKRYNDFIAKNVSETSDFWICFIHQDFGIEENINDWLKNADKKCIYGAVGAKQFDSAQIDDKNFDLISLTFGVLKQGHNDFNFELMGKPFVGERDVDTTDCCCIIVHSSLINKYNLKFDENLKFHLYAEEFCYRAKHKYKIGVKIKAMKCFHIGLGNYNRSFYLSADYLKKKFNIEKVPSTCSN